MPRTTFDDTEHDERLTEVAPTLRDELAMLYDGHDPWGSVIGFAFAVNDLAHVTGNPTDDTYSPGLGIMSATVDELADDDDYPVCMLAELYRDGVLTDAELEAAVPVLSEWLDALKGAGLDY